MAKGSSGDHEHLLQRQVVLRELREHYARFGDHVVQYLFEKSFRRGGLRMVLTKVMQSVPHDDNRMHEALIRFLSTEGVETFFDRVELKGKAKDGDTGSEGSVKVVGRDLDGVPLVEFDPNAIQPVEGYHPEIVPGATAPATASPVERPPTPPPHTKQSEPTTPHAPQPSSHVRTHQEGPWDGRERRSGFEMRLGIERRSNKERRKEADLIFKNLRFGAPRRTKIERRSGYDRRANPPPPNF